MKGKFIQKKVDQIVVIKFPQVLCKLKFGKELYILFLRIWVAPDSTLTTSACKVRGATLYKLISGLKFFQIHLLTPGSTK